MDSTRSATYAYDALGRLKEAAITGSPTSKWHYLYTYDRYGNLTDKTLQPDSLGSHPTLSLTVNAATNRITSTGFSYDAGGNMTQDGLNTYTYDAENRAVTGAGATYSYDGASLRVKKVVGSTTTCYIFSGTKVIAEYTGATPTLSTEYVYAGSQLLVTLSSSGVPTYHHPDHLSARVFTDSTGVKTGERGHYPFGEIWYPNPDTTDKWKFTSYERDSESGLDYAIFRYDSPRLGRFMTPDPLAGTIRNPQSLNRYAYVINDPVNFVDPFGLICTQIWAGGVWTTPVCTDDTIPTVPFSLALANIGDALFRLIGKGSFRILYPLDPPNEPPGRRGPGGSDAQATNPCKGFQPPVSAPDQNNFAWTSPPYSPSSPHPGNDYAVPAGTTVTAPLSGQAITAQPQTNFGNVVVASNDNGGFFLVGFLQTLMVNPGDRLVAGQTVLGTSAPQTGSKSTGEHIHFGMFHNLPAFPQRLPNFFRPCR